MKNFVAVLAVIAIDQITKYLAFKGLLSPVGGLFESTLCNPFIAWSIPLSPPALAITWFTFALIFIVLLVKTNWNTFLLVAFAGALSNAIDRIHLDCVIDFISIAQFPTFNIADSCITIGIMLFLLTKHLEERKSEKVTLK